MTELTKMVIPVAGLGTRVLPASKVIPKEMLTVVDKPVIQYVIEEAKRNLNQQEHLNNLGTHLSKVRIVPEADPSIPCPIDLPDKDSPVFMAAATAKANYLVTGDVTHFGKYFGQTIMGVRICRARHYVLSRMNL